MTELSATGGRDVHTVRFPATTPPATVDVLPLYDPQKTRPRS